MVICVLYVLERRLDALQNCGETFSVCLLHQTLWVIEVDTFFGPINQTLKNCQHQSRNLFKFHSKIQFIYAVEKKEKKMKKSN